MDCIYYRRVSFIVACLWVIAAFIACWPWSLLALTVIIPVTLAKGIQNERKRNEDAPR